MTDNPFYRLAPFVQEFIYSNKWEELRDIQVEACRAIFDTDDHVILSSGTASGKTEAAFFPILSQEVEAPSRSVGILYIGPLKALINDQFERLNDLLAEANIPVWHWHGDVNRSEKMRLLKNPSGILQITPESLEALLINRSADVVRLFSYLKYVVIDEVHAFFGTDRGSQILCQLARIQRMTGNNPRRIGLSATISDHTSAEQWIASGTSRKVILVKGRAKHNIRLAIEHFNLQDVDDDKEPQGTQEFNNYLYDNCANKKCLIFTNSRGESEQTIRSLRDIAVRKKDPDIFYVHHGSISAVLREEAESALRDKPGPTVSAATLTLELGIDIGDLERILQINSPYTCSSFVQRLGRSGRRSNVSEMLFVHKENREDSNLAIEKIPWTLLQNIAIVELYKNEQWIEPFRLKKCPFSLLYHQTMSTMASAVELAPQELAKRVLTLPPFVNVSHDDFKELLRHLIKEDHLQWTDEKTLLLGLKGERITGNFHFYSVFPDSDDYIVLEQAREIGSLNYPPPLGESVLLAGRAWQVIDLDHEAKHVYVKEVRGRATSVWSGHGGEVHTHVVRKVREILASTDNYPYLQPQARSRLTEGRALCHDIGLLSSCLHKLGQDTLILTPWAGTREISTIHRMLIHGLRSELGIVKVEAFYPYYIKIQTQLSKSEFFERIKYHCQNHLDGISFVGQEEKVLTDKYDHYLPPTLVRNAFMANELDIIGACQQLAVALGDME